MEHVSIKTLYHLLCCMLLFISAMCALAQEHEPIGAQDERLSTLIHQRMQEAKVPALSVSVTIKGVRQRFVNGAGNIGLMCTVSDAALAAGGTVTGVIPHFMVEQDWYHKGLTELIEVETMHERKQLMANLSDAVIALPGGCGTLEELLEIITWKQLGLYLNPIVILNINHYYDPLLELLRNAMNENFMRPQHAKMWAVADTPEEAIRLIHAEPKWDASLRKIAAI